MSILKRIANALGNLLASKKAQVAVATAIAGVVAPRLGTSPTETAYIVGAGIAFVLAQGQADKGKEAAKIAAATDWSASDKVLAARLKIVSEAMASALAPRKPTDPSVPAPAPVPMDTLP